MIITKLLIQIYIQIIIQIILQKIIKNTIQQNIIQQNKTYSIEINKSINNIIINNNNIMKKIKEIKTDILIRNKKTFIFKNKIKEYTECETDRIILIPESIIQTIINKNLNIKSKIYIYMFKYMINKNLYMKEFTNQCIKFKQKPKTGCTIKIYNLGQSMKSSISSYLYYQAIESKCNYIYINLYKNISLYDLLTIDEKIIISNENYKEFIKSLQRPIILIPKYSNIDILETSSPCNQIKNYNCNKIKNLEIILTIIDLYKYLIFSELCEQVYNILTNTYWSKIDEIEYRLINEISTSYQYINKTIQLSNINSNIKYKQILSQNTIYEYETFIY